MASDELTQTLPTQRTGQAKSLSPNTIKRGNWFRHRPKPEHDTAAGAALKALVGAAIGGIFYAMGSHGLAIAIWIAAAIIGLVTIGSQAARTQIGRLFAALGRALGWLFGALLLTPLYLIGFTIVRIVGRIAGRDPLHLRDKESQTFWLPADQDRRKIKHIRSLYATETLAPMRGWGVIALTSIAALLIISELVLRMLGFGHTILYRPDTMAGYFPGPNQSVQRYGGLIETNAQGMRGPEISAEKPPGTTRILMLGDSTLWGGSYVDQPDIYARRLEKLLGEKFGDKKVEVLNMSANAWGPFNELGYVEKYGTYGADIAVIALPIGDIYRGLAQLSGLPYFATNEPPRLALEEVLRHLNWRSREMMRKPEKGGDAVDQRALGIAEYVKLAKFLRDHGTEVFIEILPSRTSGTTGATPEAEQKDVDVLRAALEQEGFAVGFPAGLFKGKGTEDDLYRDACHLRTLGHGIYADYLDSRFRKESAKLRALAETSHAAGGSEAKSP